MAEFVIRNNETGKYVAPAGSEKSYTGKLERARFFKTFDEARAEACGNEIVLSRYDLFVW